MSDQRVYNFSAGPSMLPLSVLERAGADAKIQIAYIIIGATVVITIAITTIATTIVAILCLLFVPFDFIIYSSLLNHISVLFYKVKNIFNVE